MILNPENYCIPCRHKLIGQTTKQPLSNFEPRKPWNYKQFWGLRPDPSCLQKKVSYHINFYVAHDFFHKQHFISNAKLKLAKNQPNAKQHPEVELLLSWKENVCLYSWDYIFNYSEKNDENEK